MRWEEFVKKFGNLPVIEVETLLTGIPDPNPIKVQISRWEKAGKLIQLKRGVYLLAETYRKTSVFEPFIASILKKPSYVSLEKALEYYDLIPEAVNVCSSVTPKRPGEFFSEGGRFSYQHIKLPFFWGYVSVTMNGQTGFMASPEKALLDFFYLKRFKITAEYIGELRLQNVEQVDLDKLLEYAKKFKKPGMLRAAKLVQKFIQSELKKEKKL